MESIKLLIEGFIIGIGKIIPGVSGAMFAMMFGVYEKAIIIISDLKKLKGNLKFMILLCVSILFAIIFGSSLIKFFLDKYYLYTMMLFIGMMAAGIKPLFNNVKGKEVTKKNITGALLVVFLLVAMSLLDVEGVTDSLDKNLLTVFIIFICGMIDAVGTVIPGVCGTALLMLIGYYDKIITSLSNLLVLKDIGETLFVLIPFVLGLIVGIIFVSKLINYLFKKHRTTTFCAIIGFAIVSTIVLLIQSLSSKFTTIELFISLILFILGYSIVYLLESKWNQKKNDHKQ